MVILTGRPVRSGVRLGPHHIVDMAPTILHLLGYPVPVDMDGQVMIEALQNDYLKKHPVRVAAGSWEDAGQETGLSRSEEAEIAQRLRALGYL